MPLIIATIIASHAALFTPVTTPVNLMVVGPGGCKFGDYWNGLPLAIWCWPVVAQTIVPMYRRFQHLVNAAFRLRTRTPLWVMSRHSSSYFETIAGMAGKLELL